MIGKHAHPLGAHSTMDQCNEKCLETCGQMKMENGKKFYYLLLHLLFLQEILGLYPDILMYLYAVASKQTLFA